MRELKFKFSGALLMILTVAAAVSAFINFQQQRRFKLPDDGVTWVDRNGSVTALHVTHGSPADRVGMRNGDVVVKIAGEPILRSIEVSQVLVGVGAWNKATYVLRRDGRRVRSAADRRNGSAELRGALLAVRGRAWSTWESGCSCFSGAAMRPARCTFIASAWRRSSCQPSTTPGS